MKILRKYDKMFYIIFGLCIVLLMISAIFIVVAVAVAVVATDRRRSG
jgi:predicted membrane channel-forming protein YqfA (hemolysin III family)